MTASNRPARWRLGLLAASLAAAIAVPALAHDTLRTIGTPPGIVLPLHVRGGAAGAGLGRPGLQGWRGVGVAPAGCAGRCRRAGTRRQRHRRGCRHPVHAQRRGAAVLRHRRWRLHEDHLARHNRTFAIDAREKAPAAATPTQFVLTDVPAAQRFTIASTSGLAVGVPGTPAAVDTALKRWGTIRLAEAIALAIQA